MDPQALALNPLTLALAAGAGFLSFVSPCVLPLLPAYLGYMTGLTVEELQGPQDAATRAHIVGRSLAFVIGLSLVFAALGASASAVGQALLRNQTIILRIAGLLVVLLGLHTLGLIRIPFLLPGAAPHDRRHGRQLRRGAAARARRSRPAGRPASGRSWPACWRSRARSRRSGRGRCCCSSTGSGWACRSC